MVTRDEHVYMRADKWQMTFLTEFFFFSLEIEISTWLE